MGLLNTTGLLKDGRPDTRPQADLVERVGPADLVERVGSASGGSGAGAAEFDYDKAIQPDRERPASQPGAIVRVMLDTDHWLTAGGDEETQTMIDGNRVFAPLKLDAGRNVGVYAKKDRLIASGLICRKHRTSWCRRRI